MDAPTSGNQDSNQQAVGSRVDKVLSGLRKEYVVVGKAHVKVWHAWLALGVVAGIAASIIIVANRSGEFEKGRAAGGGQFPEIAITLDRTEYKLGETVTGTITLTNYATTPVPAPYAVELAGGSNNISFKNQVSLNVPVGKSTYTLTQALGFTPTIPNQQSYYGKWYLTVRQLSNIDIGAGLSPLHGQTVSFLVLSPLGPTLRVARNPATPPSQTLLTGSLGNVVSVFDFSSAAPSTDSTSKGITVTNIVATVIDPSGRPIYCDYGTLKLYDGSSQIGFMELAGGCSGSFVELNLIIPKDSKKSLTLKLDVRPISAFPTRAVVGERFSVGITDVSCLPTCPGGVKGLPVYGNVMTIAAGR